MKPSLYKRIWWQFKHWLLCCICAVGIIIALLVAIILEPLLRVFSPSAHKIMWRSFCDILGISEANCRFKHKHHHAATQIEYGGKYLIHCSKCGFSHYKES